MQKESSKLSSAKELNILRQIANLASAELDLNAVLNETVAIVKEITAADSVCIYLMNKERQELMLKISSVADIKRIDRITVKLGEGITGLVARDKEPIAISRNAYQDPRFKGFAVLKDSAFESFLSVPMVFKGRIIGIINVQHTKPRKHSKTMIGLLETIGKQIGGIIENAVLYEEMKTKLVQFDGLKKVSKTITSEKYLDEILNLIVVVTGEMFDSKICSIMLLDEKTGLLAIKATNSLSPEYKNKAPLKLDKSLSGDVVKEKRPRTVFDVKKEQRYAYRDLAIKENLSSMLLVPMIFKDKTVGIVNVYTKAAHEFTPQEIDTLQIIANQAAVAIENTKLMDETSHAKEALESRKLIDRAKGILMHTARLDEDAAYKLIKKKSMDSCRSMKEVAEAIILMAELNRPSGK